MPICKQWVMVRRCNKGPLSEDVFEMREDHSSDLRKGEILSRSLFLSIDPITRLYMSYGMSEMDVLPGRQVARVVESRHRDFPKGSLVCGSMGWQTYSVLNPDSTQTMCGSEVPLVTQLPRQLDSSAGLPKSACLGVLGVPGLTAYVSLVHVCRARPGETLVVSSAAGQIGHLAGQIGKHLGLTVIGFAGDAEKASWIKTELGFDWAFNYKVQDTAQTLRIAAPKGVDIFLDSVGGIFHNAVLDHMAQGGRICVLGNLSCYSNPKSVPMVPANDVAIALKELTITGFNIHRHLDKKEEALDKLSEWCKDGVIVPYEHVVEGFENMPTAFMDMMEGKSQGKVIVRV